VATGTALELASNDVDTMDGIIFNGSPTVTAPPPLPLTSGIPFHFTAGSRRSLAKSEPGPKASTIPAQFHDQLGMGRIEQHSPGDQTVSPVPGFLPSTSARGSPIPWTMDSSSSSVRSSPTPVESGGGLLARKLRDLQAQNGVDAFQD
jgi:hypothetical protein